MSDVFSMGDTTADDKVASALANNVDSFDDVQTTAFRGAPQGLFSGVMRGGAKAATAVGMAAGGLTDLGQNIGANIFEPLGFDVSRDPIVQDEIFRTTDELGQSAVDFWTPKPNEVGRVGQVLGGLGEIVLPLVATAGNPELLVASNTANTGKELVDQGVDIGTAGTAAAVQGVAAYGGMKAPILGGRLLTRMLSGAAGNVAVSTGANLTTAGVLRSQDYDQQAGRYAVTGEGLTTDFLTGLLFGAVHHALSPAEVDAALTGRTANSFNRETAPGVPKDTGSSVAHQDALSSALETLAKGEPVNVGESVARHDGAAFEPDGRATENAEVAQAATEAAREAAPDSNPLTLDVDGKQIMTRSANGYTEAWVRGGDTLQITNTETSADAKGNGEGVARMRRLIDYAEAKGLKVVSDTQVSADAVRVYEGLKRRGFEVTRNEASIDADGGLKSDTGRPVFEVSRKQPEAPSNVSELPLEQAMAAKPAEAVQLPPEIESLRQLSEANPDAVVDTGASDAEGNSVRTTAKEAYEQTRQEYEQAANDTKAYDAAVACILRTGT